MIDGLKALLDMRAVNEDGLFGEGVFKDNLRRTYVKVGLRKTLADRMTGPHWRKYQANTLGTSTHLLNPKPY